MKNLLYTQTCRRSRKLLCVLGLAKIFFIHSFFFPFDTYAQVFNEIKYLENPNVVANTQEMGYSVSIDGDYAIVGARRSDVFGSDKGLAYLLYKNQGGVDNWGVLKTLSASDAADGDTFGSSVSIDGDYIVIGAETADPSGMSNRGKAYVYYRNEGGVDNWGEQQILVSSNGAANDKFGHSVAISGTTIVVGANGNDVAASAAGAAYVFEKDEGGPNNWGAIKFLSAFDAANFDRFGDAVSIDNSTIVVGATGDDDTGSGSGSIYIFKQNEGGANNWGFIKKKVASDGLSGDQFGYSVAIRGDYLIVGAPFADIGGQPNIGKSYLLERNEGGIDNWGERKILSSSNGQNSNNFGYAVAIHDTRAVVGAFRFGISNPGTSDEGAIYIFEKDEGSSNNWGEEETKTASNYASIDRFGGAVGISGSYIIAGAPQRDGGSFTNVGAVYIFKEGTTPTTDVAITEWLSNPSGTESDEEWVEIYNYGSSSVNLKNWRLKDEDTDDAPISTVDLFLPAGESLILARDKVAFETHWLKGCASDKVVEVSMTLGNGADEIILEDDNGTVIWSVAYSNDETEGRATHYTEVTYTNSTYGSKASPGVDRTGNDVTGTLGYERNNTTADANAFANALGDVGSPISAHLKEYTRGNTILLDGLNDHLNLGATTALEGQSGFTFETWIKPVSMDAGTERIFSKRSGNTNRIEISMGSGGSVDADRQFLTVHICNGTNETARIPNGSVPLGIWSHIAVIFDGTQSGADRLKILVNGIPQTVTLSPTATTTPSGNGNAHIGKRSDNNNKPSNVELDEIRLWNVARTNDAVREHMHLTLTGCETGLVSYYQLNETTGTIATDVQGNNNATLINGVSRNVSPINVGNSASSNSQTITGISTATNQAFTIANLEIDVTAKTGMEDWTVTYQAFDPNVVAGTNGVTVYSTPTWTINSATTTGTYVGNLTFTFPAGSFSSTAPVKYRLYNRSMHAGGDWKEIASASLVTSNTITFSNIEVLGQFMVVQQSADGVSPVRGNMYSFDGVDDYIDMGNPAVLNMNTAITIEGWVKMNNIVGDQKIVTKFGDVSNDDAYALQIIGGDPRFFLNFGATWVGCAAGMTLSPNEWHHIAAVYDGATMKIYVDGIERNSVAQTGSFDVATSTFKIGGWKSGNYWNGYLDEIRIWGGARSQTEIREAMHLTLKGNETNLAAYYQFNEDDPLNTVGGVKDALGATNGTTVNMTGAAYTASEVAVAGGVSQTIIVPATGPFTATYSSAGLAMSFDATAPNGEVVVSRLETERPDGWNTLTGLVDDEYFVIKNYGSNATFTALTNISLLDVGYIDPVEAAQPEASSPLHIYKRASNAYGGTWGSALANANTAISGYNGQVNFDNSANITSFSQLALVSTGNSLPVELMKFDAVRQDANRVNLEWATASETNNQGFHVERMLENETAFSEIAWIEGKGTTVMTNYYQHIDENSSLETSYYRLKQVDFGGTTTYSEIKAVGGLSSGTYIDWSIYPNPTSDYSQVVFMQVPKNITSANIKLVTMDGKLIYQATMSVKSNQKIGLDFMKELSPGVYLLSIETNDGEFLKDKIIKR